MEAAKIEKIVFGMEEDVREIGVFADMVGQLALTLPEERDQRMFVELGSLIGERLEAVAASWQSLLNLCRDENEPSDETGGLSRDAALEWRRLQSRGSAPRAPGGGETR